MGQATLNFDFETQFQGVYNGNPDTLATEIEAIIRNPQDFVECGWDLTDYKVHSNIQGNQLSVKLFFTIKFTDDEELISDGSYTRDMVAIWENDFPHGELTLRIDGVDTAPKVAKCIKVH